MIIGIINNLALLVALSVLSGFIDKRWQRTTLSGKLLQGILFSITVVFSILYPYVLVEGLIFDGRSVIISVCTLFFGPIPGIITVVFAIITRIYIGGGGVFMGISVILSSFLIGLLFYNLRQKKKISLNFKELYFFGLLVHIIMISLMSILPSNLKWIAIKNLATTVILLYPIATLLVAKVLKDQEDNSILIQDLLESKKDLSTTLNSIADAVISTDIKGIVVNMNPVAEKLCGWSEKEAIGKSLPEIFNIINSETRESILNPVGKVLESGRVTGLSNHTVLISKDGNEYHISDSAAPIRNDKNSITGFVMVFSDITEKYNATRELNERNIFIQTVLDNLPIGVSISEFDNGNITYMNKKFIEIFGWTEEELTSIDVLLEKFYPDEPNKQQLTEKILADIKSSDKSKTQLENVKITTKSGHKRIINAVNIPLFVMNSIVSTVSDITNLKKAEEELQKIAKLESLGVLAGGIAHNFKNMLTAMNMNLELAKMKPDNTPYYLDRMEKSIDQASALATRFQTFSASGKPVLSLTDINNTIREAVEIALSGSQASVHYNLDNQISKVLADDKQLNEVFTNLIINADQAMPKGGNIYISSSLKEFDDFEIHNLPSGKFIEISIKDDGIGISDEYISDIFTPFFSTKTKGQGLGLASVYYIVEKHKGAVTVSSEINMGATFNIYLPLLVDMEDTNNNSEDTILKNRNLRILLLDDDISIVENFKDISGILEFELIGLSNPHETLRFYKKIYKEKFLDFVILDLTLKGFEIDGHDVLLELKRINPKVRALVFSGHSTKPIVADYKKYGFVGRIEKPFLLKQFISEINRLS